MSVRKALSPAAKPSLIALFSIAMVVGCAQKAPSDPGVPAGADLLTDVVSPPGERSEGSTPLEIPADGALYVFDATRGDMVYAGPLKAGDVLKLSWGGVRISGRLPTRSGFGAPAYERQVARYDAGSRYRVYYQPGGTAADPSLEGSPLTRPYETRTRELNPLDPGRR